jgi:hypothetical protein
MSDVKKPKLTAKQQEVVNLMAAGWVLQWTRPSFGGKLAGGARLVKGTDWHPLKMRQDMGEALRLKGVAESRKGGHWLDTDYRLTELGKSLAEQPQ